MKVVFATIQITFKSKAKQNLINGNYKQCFRGLYNNSPKARKAFHELASFLTRKETKKVSKERGFTLNCDVTPESVQTFTWDDVMTQL